jgi:adenylate cyclase class 2
LNEIEVKILDIDKRETEKKLLSAGAKKISEKEVETLFFDFKDFSIKKNKSLIRLRKEKETCTLTFKKLIESKKAKVANEYEVIVSDIDNAKHILESIGLFVHAKMRKIRTSYIIYDTKFEFDKYLDEYDHIPEFLEIEAKSIEDIYKYVKLLGYEHDKCKAWSTYELIKYYSNKKRNK